MALTPNDDDDDTRRLFASKLFRKIFSYFSIYLHTYDNAPVTVP